jgi:hypothetical protein
MIEWVRRADCLYTMIGVRHRIKTGDNNFLKHDAGLIEANTLRSAQVVDPFHLGAIGVHLASMANRSFGHKPDFAGRFLGWASLTSLLKLMKLKIQGFPWILDNLRS